MSGSSDFRRTMRFAATKLYYKIGEVCEIVGVETHVLRYWESEFPTLSPPKNRAGQRTYRPKDIEQLLEIRRLLYDEGFTIAGARKRLGGGSSKPVPAPRPTGRRRQSGASPAARPPKTRARRLHQVREELENILTLLRNE